jgi:hypothetical protein
MAVALAAIGCTAVTGCTRTTEGHIDVAFGDILSKQGVEVTADGQSIVAPVEGWFDTQGHVFAIAKDSYGLQPPREVECETGLPRPDVSASRQLQRSDGLVGFRCRILIPRSSWIDTRGPNGTTLTIGVSSVDYIVWTAEGGTIRYLTTTP